MTTTSLSPYGPCPECSAAGTYCKCSCDECDPNTSGPAEDCPEHGDVRLYAKWLDETCIAYDEREVEFKQQLADQAATTARLWAGQHVTAVCTNDRARLTAKAEDYQARYEIAHDNFMTSVSLRNHASRYIEEMRTELTDKDEIIANLRAWIEAHHE